MPIKTYLKLVRTHQWYKNLVVFLAIFFSGNIFNFEPLVTTTLAFISLILISSTNYIINDLIDYKEDKLHPDRGSRPLASGQISKEKAAVLAIFLLIAGLVLAVMMGNLFFYAALSLFVLTQIYTFLLKKIIFADVLTIASLFVIRAIAGALAINVIISPWLILVPFFLALFLAVGKRHADLNLLKDKAASTKKVLKYYNNQITNSLMTISTTMLILSYALYSFLSEYNNLIYTLPFAIFVIFRFYYLITTNTKIALKTEKVIKDKATIIGILLWLVITALFIYI